MRSMHVSCFTFSANPNSYEPLHIAVKGYRRDHRSQPDGMLLRASRLLHCLTSLSSFFFSFGESRSVSIYLFSSPVIAITSRMQGIRAAGNVKQIS